MMITTESIRSTRRSQRRTAEESLRDETRVLELLIKTGIAIASELNLESLVQIVTDGGRELSGAQFGAFFFKVINQDGESFLLEALSGASHEAFAKFDLPRDTRLFNPPFRGQGVVRSGDILADPRYGTMEPHHGMPLGRLPVRSYLAVPVISHSGEVIGGLFFGHRDTNVFTDRSERLIVGIASQAAVAIDNARLYEAAQREIAERNLAHDAMKKSQDERQQLLEGERAARMEAEKLSRLKDEFLANLSHELRTPLNAILGWTHLLRKHSSDKDRVLQGVEVIERSGRIQAQLVSDLLDMSRIISGKMRLDVQRIDLPVIIEAALAGLRPAAEAKGVLLQSVLEPVSNQLRGDPNRLQQIVWNLVSNAIKFTPKDGRVHVSLASVNSHVEIAVSDTGRGIRPEFLPHVFERFRQADASSAREHGGLGIGLALVKQLAELHGGTVRTASAGEGQGATFVVHLPLAVIYSRADADGDRRHPRASIVNSPKTFEPPNLGGLNVLVVDDEPDARDVLKRLLEECGAEVVTASSVEEALEKFDASKPHLILSDIGMPKRDGYDLIAAIRKAGSTVPAAALTAFARSEDRTRALRSGYNAHLPKPVEPDELLATVAALAGRAPLSEL